MERFLFVLGSNWQLSIAELDNYLRYSKNKGKIVDYSANVAIVEFEKLHKEPYFINKLMEIQFTLGGCQKIAKIFDFIDIQTVEDAFPVKIGNYKRVDQYRKKILSIIDNSLIGKKKIFPKIYESMFFAISIYPNLYDEEYYSKILIKHFLPFLNKEISELLKQKGAVKTLYYKYPEKNITEGNLNPIFPHIVIKYDLLTQNRGEIIFGFTEDGTYLARTFMVDDPNFKKKVDEERPFKEFKSSISPKLTLIMLNFLNLFDNRKEMKILDPFVGNGTILLLAFVQDFQVFGSDRDETKVRNTIRNLNWLIEELEEEVPLFLSKTIRTSEVKDLSTNFEEYFFDGIVTEPDLGPYFLKKPYYIQAKEILEIKLEPLYNVLFQESFKLLKDKGRICLISPVIGTVDGDDIQLNLERIASKYKFKLIPILFPERLINKSNPKLKFRAEPVKNLIDAKRGQIIKRKLFIFEKSAKDEL